jgi:hypothetical protein
MNMENRFLEMDECLRRISGNKSRHGNGQSGNGSTGFAKGIASSQSSVWSESFSAQDRVLVILIENGGLTWGSRSWSINSWRGFPERA